MWNVLVDAGKQLGRNLEMKYNSYWGGRDAREIGVGDRMSGSSSPAETSLLVVDMGLCRTPALASTATKLKKHAQADFNGNGHQRRSLHNAINARDDSESAHDPDLDRDVEPLLNAAC